MNAYSIRDRKAKASNLPFFSLTRATAMREITLGLSNNAMLSAYGEDFDLFEVGTFNTETGELDGQQPHHICNIGDLTPKEDERDGETDTSVRLTA